MLWAAPGGETPVHGMLLRPLLTFLSQPAQHLPPSFFVSPFKTQARIIELSCARLWESLWTTSLRGTFMLPSQWDHITFGNWLGKLTFGMSLTAAHVRQNSYLYPLSCDWSTVSAVCAFAWFFRCGVCTVLICCGYIKRAPNPPLTAYISYQINTPYVNLGSPIHQSLWTLSGFQALKGGNWWMQEGYNQQSSSFISFLCLILYWIYSRRASSHLIAKFDHH